MAKKATKTAPRKVSKKASTTKTTLRTQASSRPPPRRREEWEKIESLGVNRLGDFHATVLHSKVELVDGTLVPYQFSHLNQVLEEIQLRNPGKDLYLYKTLQPFPLTQDANMDQQGLSGPVIIVILMPRGYEPPPFVAKESDKEEHEHEVFHLKRYLKLEWKPFPSSSGRLKNVFCLSTTEERAATKQRASRQASNHFLKEFQSVTPWIMKSVPNVTSVCVYYMLPDGSEVVLPFDKEAGDKLDSFAEEVVDDYDLSEAFKDSIKDAVREAFRKKRKAIQDRMELLRNNGYGAETLAQVSVAKIYPQNTFVDRPSLSPYVSQYYLKAENGHVF